MSRIGKKPIAILKDVKVEVKDGKVVVSGPKGQLVETLRGNITVKTNGESVTVERGDDSKHTRSLHGLYRALINNMIQGVSQGYTKKIGNHRRRLQSRIEAKLACDVAGLFSPHFFPPTRRHKN